MPGTAMYIIHTTADNSLSRLVITEPVEDKKTETKLTAQVSDDDGEASIEMDYEMVRTLRNALNRWIKKCNTTWRAEVNNAEWKAAEAQARAKEHTVHEHSDQDT